MQNPAMVRLRDELVERLKTELIGPSESEETLQERPSQRYLTGILWPRETGVEREDDEDFGAGAEGEETGVAERAAPLSQAMKPSAIGLSFVISEVHSRVLVKASWGVYTPAAAAGGTPPKGEPWKRHQAESEWLLDLGATEGERRAQPAKADDRVMIEWLSRELPGNRLAVSLFLVNRKVAPPKSARDPFSLFQPQVTVTAATPGVRPFLVRAVETESSSWRPQDAEADDLLYSDETVFAVGHGVAADWDDISPSRQEAGVIRTEMMPQYEVPQVTPPDWRGGGSLVMDDLAEAPSGTVLTEMLMPLLDAYGAWIEQQEVQMQSLQGAAQAVAADHLNACRESLARMRNGLKLISSDPAAFTAFQFANRSMALQRRQTVWARQARKASDWSGKQQAGPPPSWRPFQIAFILQALAGVVDPGHPDRSIADLLWFPTGGGKTEAYLGLAAFVMGLRRLRGEQGGMRADAGVTVIMRYTLRLLTIQQFQRASTLICACEVIRRSDPVRWGKTPFSIGLWVGVGSTPNDFDESEKAIRKADSQRASSPIQLVSCPWCGSPLAQKGTKLHLKTYSPWQQGRRTLIGCSRDGCEFHWRQSPHGIPAVVVDEEIYRLAPTLLIGTVDKFARLPYVGETQSLFGRVRGEIEGWGFVCEGDSKETDARRGQVLSALKKPANITDHRPLLPPELIIQDELHLISGPLGTMVGLYESAIEQLCSREIDGQEVGPKVVASTATIRRAGEQVKRLFNRRLAVLPSPGLKASDSFFAVQQPLSETPGRKYVGLFAPGRSVKTALVRAYATLLASPSAMNTSSPADLDPYQTLVGYFNSLRELGGAVRLLEDDVRARIKVIAGRPAGQKFGFKDRAMKDTVPELTSRVDSQDIPEILARLERSFPGDPKEPPVDAILASNMISVGVDVSRLGLMVVTGQPKTTAEYIQATSRVGREFPGLVVTVYNWARPRDMSHYERFRSYHAALYRYVEATSVTPFSSRARDRALAAALVASTRLGVNGLAHANSAVRFKKDEQGVKSLKERLLQRVQSVDGSERRKEVSSELEADVALWEEWARKGTLSYYGGGKFAKKSPRLLYQLGKPPKGALFPAPNSMRDVEPSIGIYLEREDA